VVKKIANAIKKIIIINDLKKIYYYQLHTHGEFFVPSIVNRNSFYSGVLAKEVSEAVRLIYDRVLF
jgi:hypothetical protein